MLTITTFCITPENKTENINRDKSQNLMQKKAKYTRISKTATYYRMTAAFIKKSNTKSKVWPSLWSLKCSLASSRIDLEFNSNNRFCAIVRYFVLMTSAYSQHEGQP